MDVEQAVSGIIGPALLIIDLEGVATAAWCYRDAYVSDGRAVQCTHA